MSVKFGVSRVCASTQRPFRPVPFSGPRPELLRVSRSVGKASRSCVGPLSTRFKTTPVQRRLGSPRLPRYCRTNSLKGFDRDILARQLFVGDAPSSYTRERANETRAIGGLTVVKPEYLLIQIAEQVEGFHTHVGSLIPRFSSDQKFSIPFT